MLLTDQIVAKLAIPNGKTEHIVFDEKEPGFGVRLRAGGIFGSGEGSFSGWSRAKRDLDGRIADARLTAATTLGRQPEPMPHWTLHDLRRTLDTLANEELGVLPHVTEAILNHISSGESGKKGVAKIYNRSKYAAEKRAALDAWALHLMSIVEVDRDATRVGRRP